MIAQMDRVEIVFLRSEMEDMVPFLQEQGVLHLEDVPLAIEEHPGYLHRVHLPEEEKEEKDRLEQLASLLRESAPLLSSQPSPPQVAVEGPALEKLSHEDWQKKAETWRGQLYDITRRKLDLEDNIEVLKHFRKVLNALSPMLIEHGARLGENARALVLEGYSEDGIRDLERRFYDEIGAQSQFLTKTMGKDSIAVVTFPKDKADAAAKVIEEEGIAPIDPPDKDIKGANASEVIFKIDKRIAQLDVDHAEVVSELRRYSEENGPALIALQQIVDSRLEQFEATEQFAQSEMIGVVHGWAPHEDFDALRSALKTRFGDRVALEKLPMKDVDIHTVPTQLRNAEIFKPFELILKLFSPATYGSFDPTKLVAISFILFYGFILGDAAYGLIIIGIAYWARTKFHYNAFVRDAMTIAMWMGVSSIVFGIWFFEFFGDLPARMFGHDALQGIVFHRGAHAETYLYMAIAVGVVHVPLALIMGVREGFKHGHPDHAIEKLAMLLGVGALGFFVAGYTGMLPGGAWIALAVFIVSLALFIKSMGAETPMGVIEIIGITANILSYARLMALGIASIALADIANGLTEGLPFLIGIPVALVVHILNIGIGVFSPTIHSLRLNYVEFLPKFYETEGTEYQPFRKEMAWEAGNR